MRNLLPALLLLPLLACGDKDGDDGDGGSDSGVTDDGGADSGAGTDGGTDGSTDGGTVTEVTGADLYADHCAVCHGEDARGTSSGPDLKREVENHNDDQIIRVILFGEDRMDPIDVTEDEAQMIVDYLRELFPG